ncbi:MAG: hypothetical protein GWM90_30245, partial [Gemmatimonadetes bacterium]|nr:hypothetical protein [Gemmatimonadota bacterium]NIQ59412.1 hypothetical protein [Gemmatimonadota bacterium]NIU79601.1 hypothetical protein [Gammaproteobacteria bacterium]NIX48188.1 hypothetical protein [Gemmatimonadota bacterium]NIY12599.1 hypothetical protein [Gemmatimonadota bacterium]
MADFPGSGGPAGGRRPPTLQDLDLARLYRVLGRAAWLLLLIPLWMAVSWAHSFYTDWLWFSGVGHEDVLVTRAVAGAGLFLVGVVVVLAIALPNLYYARRATGTGPVALPESMTAENYRFARKLLGRGAVAMAALTALLLATQPATEWETVLLFLNRVPFGESDPIFGHDFAFFIFTLPALELLRAWLVAAVVTVALLVAGFYYLTSRFRMDHFAFMNQARLQAALLGAALFLLIAAGHWLSRYELLYSPTGAVYGVGHTDSVVNLPGRALLTVIAVAAAGLLAWAGIRRKSPAYLVGPVVGWFIATLLIGNAAPALFQRLRVEPSELALEREYLANNIQYTRQAYGLDQLQSRSHPARGTVDAATVAENQGTIQNVRLWDESPLLQSYNQIQFFRLYYDFLAVHTDRYTVGDELRQVMLATRELSAEKLPEEAQRWVNRHLQFTHGYGVAMSPVTEVQAGGRPT